MSAIELIHAAGGVVWRLADGVVQVAVAHRPRYDDWTLPKGKLHEGESELAGAVREVGEEIGSRVAVSRRLARVHYFVNRQPKRVRYWVMRDIGGEFVASREVDEIRWLPVGAAADRLSYDLDRAVLADALATRLADAVLVLVRHAKAGKRARWPGADRDRPLDKDGRRQARRLVPFLQAFGPDTVLAADRVRCIQTVEPYAQTLGGEIRIGAAFSDEACEASPRAAVRELFELAKPGSTTVICSQGQAIPGMLGELPLDLPPVSLTTRKGAAWVLTFADGELLGADRYDDASR